MDIERLIKIPDEKRTNAELLKACQRLAFGLSGGRWSEDEKHEVSFERTVTDTVGYDVGGERFGFIESVLDTTGIYFNANKIKILTGSDVDDFLIEERYSLSSVTGQSISFEEIPSDIVATFKDAEDDDDDDMGLYSFMTKDDIMKSEIEREQTTEYTILEDGHIDDYSLSVSYYANDMIVHDSTYKIGFSYEDYMVPVRGRQEGLALENRPIILTVLNENRINGEVKDLDEDLRSFMLKHNLSEMLRIGGADEREHIGRALSLVALLTSGIQFQN